MQGKDKKVHFIGIGGAGMSGIATVMLEMGGYQVSGSDIKRSAVIDRLENLGAKCNIGHKTSNINNEIDAVVYSTAISPENPEILETQRLGIPLIRRGQMLARLMKEKKGIAVAGAHGKTTTTSMTALILEENSFDPTIIIGGDLSNIGGNAKLGQGEYMVAEADESDGSFLLLDPNIAVVTNIEDDHLDYYGTRENIAKAFRQFLAKLSAEGLAVICLDDPVLKEITTGLTCQVVTYGSLGSGADYQIKVLETRNGVNQGEVYFQEERLGMLELHVPGYHNLLNAMAAVAIGRHLNLDFEKIARALRKFTGAKRRFQVIGKVNGITVVDDYAHHPTEVKATLQAARTSHPGRIVTIFQPHRYSRTKQLFKEFGQSFTNGDLIILTDIYAASELPLEGVHTKLILDAIPLQEGQQVLYLPTLKDAADYLADYANPGDLVLTMGAGDVWTLGRELIKRLEEK